MSLTLSSINAALNTIGRLADYFKGNVINHVNDTSMTELTRLTRAEPLTIISQDLSNAEYLPQLLNTLTSIYSGYFLQAASILTTAVNNIEVVKILDSLNPNRDSTGFLLQGRHSAREDRLEVNGLGFALESCLYSLPNKAKVVMAMEEANKMSDTNKMIFEIENLAVGKLLNVDFTVGSTIGEDGKPCKPNIVTIPVSVRLSPALVGSETLNYIFTHRKEDQGIIERWHSWRSGRISLIKDMIFCQDLIDEYRKAALKDQSGILQEIQRRVNTNRAYGLLTKNPSLAQSANLYVISQRNAQEIEAKVGFKFTDPRGREKLFNGTYAMVVVVVDQDREILNFYYNGIAAPSTITLRSLKSKSGKDSGPDITDVMRSLLEGRAPTF